MKTCATKMRPLVGNGSNEEMPQVSEFRTFRGEKSKNYAFAPELGSRYLDHF